MIEDNYKLSLSELSRSNININPFKQFAIWLSEAEQTDIILPNAMSLATTDGNEIGIRTVLLKYFSERGFVFFTNYDSNKSKHIKVKSRAALLFSWLMLERQVKIFGKVKKITPMESRKYFATRHREAQLGAWASNQSSRISSREVLLSRFNIMKNKFSDGIVPLPDFWGGYSVMPQTIEFWQGRENRLHDRFIYTKKGSRWLISRLAP